MKVIPYARTPGQAKMRGRKACAYSCGCCVLFDRRDELIWQEAANELKYEEEDDELEPAA